MTGALFAIVHAPIFELLGSGAHITRTVEGCEMSGAQSGFPPINDYAIIGDSRTAALVSRAGSIDWLCIPHFDSPAIFAAILDARRGGYFQVKPMQTYTIDRRYVGETNVLETTFTTATGVMRLTDLMVVASEESKRHRLWPDHQLVRAIDVTDGEVTIGAHFEPRPGYGEAAAHLVDRGKLGLVLEDKRQTVTLLSDVPLELDELCASATGSETLHSGERRYVSVVINLTEPAVLPPLGDYTAAQIEESIRWWEEWSGMVDYDGVYREWVVRGALTLKLMAFAPSGAVVAAPTASLPEWIGGERNWDYRYCWLRDASLTLRALFDIGCTDEAKAFLSWLLHATRLTWPELQVLYDVYGETNLPERELDYLTGYRESQPVRIGNAACDQLQLDVYGEVIDAAHQFVSRGGRLDRETSRVLVGFGRTVCRRWREADEGVWEVRSGRRHHTFSKAMCWVALDRLIKLSETGQLPGAPVALFRRERWAIYGEIERHGYNKERQSYVSEFDGREVDASLLLLGIYGYEDPAGLRMRSTSRRIHTELGRNGLLYRYHAEDGVSGREGAFGICSFWGVEARALEGEVRAAVESFEHLLSFANDLGLFAEEIDPETGAALGNFPQAFTHVGLINAALTLDACIRTERHDTERNLNIEVEK